jgi:hypothetical protein
MPFKGDMRLGGPRDNESTMNGFSVGPSFPAEGTILSVLSNIEFPIGNGGASVNISEDEYAPDDRASQRGNFNVVADGLGGQYTDWANPISVEFYPSGTIIVENVSTETSYLNFDVNSTNYENGYTVVDKVHDGAGGWSFSGTTIYNTTSNFYSTAEDVSAEFDNQSYVVGHGTRDYYHDGAGGYVSSLSNVVYFHDEYVVGSVSTEVSIQLPDGNYYVIGSTSYEVWSDGLGGAYAGNEQTTYSEYGTYIMSYEGYDYYSDSEGWYYTQEGAPAYGTETGNTEDGNNYLEIYGNQYDNGTYSGIEYHDGGGGTYWEYSYSYQPYGTEFTSFFVDDGNGGGYTEYYYSDGEGSYYIESY